VHKEKIRIGVAGLGGIAKRIHMPILHKMNGVELVAGAERDDYQRERVKRLFNLKSVYHDFEEMLDAGGLDAVYVCLPNFLHHRAVMKSLGLGYHVLCEKPMGLTAAEAVEMAALAREKGLVLMPAYNLRFVDVFRRAREIVLSGKLGRILQAQVVYLNPGPYLGWDPKSDWYLKEGGHGVLYDIGGHMLDIFSTIFPYPLEVRDVKTNLIRGFEGFSVPTNISSNFIAGESTLVSLDLGWRTGSQMDRISLHGTAGTLNVSRFFLQHLHRGTDPGDYFTNYIGNGLFVVKDTLDRIVNIARGNRILKEYLREAEAFIKALRGECPQPIEPEEAAVTLSVLEAIAASMDQPEQLPQAVKTGGKTT
jgi:predicted dehydrogenase